MADVAEWLNRLGLGKYAVAFAEQEIEFEHLSLLTEVDVRDLGLPIGPRRKLLAAIETLRATRHTTQDRSKWQGEAERRQLTVMFVDLANSTRLALRLDPETMRGILRAFQDTVAGEIGRLGFVAKLMGDGVLAYFGWPQANEDDARRAVTAALAIVEAVAKLSSPEGQPLACRIGIATGLVVVGDLIGKGAAQEREVVGPTPNLAARLQEVAGPGEIMVSVATRRLLGAEFAVEEIGERQLKGHEQPVTLFRVIHRETWESRFAARGAENSIPIIGRDVELVSIRRAWEEAKTGRGRAILMTGDAGIGKSRLVQALAGEIGAETVRHLFQCSPLHNDNPFWPIASRLAPAAMIVGRAMEDLGGAMRHQVRREVITALTAQLLPATHACPSLLVFEDAQWIDQATLEFVRHLTGVIGDAPVLLLVTGRPDVDPHFTDDTSVSRIALTRLDQPSAKALVTAVAGSDQVAPRLLADILARSDGVPLYLEEMTKSVIETDKSGTAVSVPITLRDSLTARLDVAPAMKVVAQIASCIGREFDEALLLAVSDIDAGDLRAGLIALLRADLIETQPGGGFRFKHALLCDIAYETLLTERRQRLHRSIAEAIEAMPKDLAELEPETLARHWYAAAENGRAESYWLRARHRAAHWQERLDALEGYLEGDVSEVFAHHDVTLPRKLH